MITLNEYLILLLSYQSKVSSPAEVRTPPSLRCEPRRPSQTLTRLRSQVWTGLGSGSKSEKGVPRPPEHCLQGILRPEDGQAENEDNQFSQGFATFFYLLIWRNM